MKAYMTKGTYPVLKKIEEKNPGITFSYMEGSGGTLAYYEGEGKSIFSAGRAFDILLTKGKIAEKGFVAMNNIPVLEEGQPVFEEQFRNRLKTIDNTPGFKAFRLLKPLKGHTYIVFTQWGSEKDFEDWKASPQFKAAHDKHAIKTPAYFADRPFLSTYHMVKED
ncbi:antibiotic biosynthesis monooxygenase [Virgibacillus sp. 179-BFC.A HS]|uniref:Antibiotic biosynthesis monooxygenase n=1 Tax=Tigheibacillus jepli TaxID=3035914 RepID=A0ABU5CL42_9BACI|nr:antibiotic biosynthesis monooxygenase [Virgibacillus sp. 179-BFC.A HS]MDY0406223.1 antibiotic biosynthesis monooxygenase [Virgibacillus sp. 179-BFC.A HS]